MKPWRTSFPSFLSAFFSFSAASSAAATCSRTFAASIFAIVAFRGPRGAPAPPRLPPRGMTPPSLTNFSENQTKSRREINGSAGYGPVSAAKIRHRGGDFAHHARLPRALGTGIGGYSAWIRLHRRGRCQAATSVLTRASRTASVATCGGRDRGSSRCPIRWVFRRPEYATQRPSQPAALTSFASVASVCDLTRRQAVRKKCELFIQTVLH